LVDRADHTAIVRDPPIVGTSRRLAAILAADVAGYSRLMGADEEGTLARLKAHRRDLVDPKIAEHRGRIVKTTGDGLLVEFASVVDAVRCAAEIQRGMLDRDPDVLDERRIRFRIGVNLGDIIVDGGDIFGDGVNVAARLLEGSVRRSGSQLRVSAQLIDAATDAHLWAERFDSDTGNLFTLQNEITSRIAVALNIELTSREAARPTEHPDALDYILRGRAAYWKPNSLEKWVETVSLFEHALALDPQSVEAQSWLANALAFQVANGYASSGAAEIRRAEELIGKALASSPRNWFAHYAKGSLRRVVQHRCEEAIPEYEIALALNPYWMNTLVGLGSCKLLTGSIEEVIPLSEQAIRLSPRDPFISIPFIQIGQVHLLQSRTDEAIIWLEKARNAFPGYPEPHAWLSSAYALKGETERAAAELGEARRLMGEGYYLSIAHLSGVYDFGVPKVRALFETTYLAGLRKAGMPE